MNIARGRDEPAAAAFCGLTHLALTQFRNYRHLTVDLAAGPVVLLGGNGAGKTNLLEAISLLGPGSGGEPADSRARHEHEPTHHGEASVSHLQLLSPKNPPSQRRGNTQPPRRETTAPRFRASKRSRGLYSRRGRAG